MLNFNTHVNVHRSFFPYSVLNLRHNSDSLTRATIKSKKHISCSISSWDTFNSTFPVLSTVIRLKRKAKPLDGRIKNSPQIEI